MDFSEKVLYVQLTKLSQSAETWAASGIQIHLALHQVGGHDAEVKALQYIFDPHTVLYLKRASAVYTNNVNKYLELV